MIKPYIIARSFVLSSVGSVSLVLTVIALASFGLVAPAATAQEVEMTLEDAWVRAMPPSGRMTAAYMTIVNNSESAYGIIGARAEHAASAELHTTRSVDGVVHMEQLEGLAIAPGERVELRPGGTHLMLMGLTFMPVPGDTVELCLELLGGAEICTEALTRRQ